ncbi:hypothetical protein AMAG_11528 [Allomyces macrogynus ATCC 38327]|uniref:RPA-interacting protein C-terminal domain-containing protein n=1 Tax=Allomyces macrogynus (strain ATCC 38327) TaxID=578462 RepID=A0A0L0SV89_ALLM3|nr:hypothetical protein AMAG_11528 [Allomyces macrogynus ATCC 38327]|eukprot:KNE66386.1 hypothetical protein AMAG_11528 [Allomyces macrogynus ATCC 38327]
MSTSPNVPFHPPASPVPPPASAMPTAAILPKSIDSSPPTSSSPTPAPASRFHARHLARGAGSLSTTAHRDRTRQRVRDQARAARVALQDRAREVATGTALAQQAELRSVVDAYWHAFAADEHAFLSPDDLADLEAEFRAELDTGKEFDVDDGSSSLGIPSSSPAAASSESLPCLLCDARAMIQVGSDLMCCACHARVSAGISYETARNVLDQAEMAHGMACPGTLVRGYHPEEGFVAQCMTCGAGEVLF